MARYEIFRKPGSEHPTWVETATSWENAMARLKELTQQIPAKYFILDCENSVFITPSTAIGQELPGTLSGINRFEDRLTVLFRRAVNARDTLSVMVIRVTPKDDVDNTAEVATALQDTVKAISTDLRKGDALCHFGENVFGIILPSVAARTADIVAKRLRESLRSTTGAPNRFAYDIKVFNYPQHVASASEVENAIRSLLPEVEGEREAC